MLRSLFNKLVPTLVFSGKCCQLFKNTCFEEYLWTAGSECYLQPQEKSLKIHEWERYGYSHLFSMNWEKIFPYIGKLWKLVPHIWELRGFLNLIDFHSKSMGWKYISCSHNIPIVWNFTLPIFCGLCGFCSNF